jgi:lipopolysaccharide biosynthesis glycosyltransferase
MREYKPVKYLYVLTSDHHDFYYEQALLSITSLRNKMPGACISLLVDKITADSLRDKRTHILTIIDEYKVVAIPDSFTKMQCSRWLKTSMRQHISGDFLYIDCDTIISEDLSDVSNLTINIGAVLNSHCLLEHDFYKHEAIGHDKELGFTSTKSNRYFNGGVVYCSDTPECHAFFSEWHKLWRYSILKNINMDQPSFNQANSNSNYIIAELNGEWNCQIAYGGIAYLTNAKIIHYFGIGREEKPYLLANRDIFTRIRELGYIPSDVTEQFAYAKTLFSFRTRLISDAKRLAVIDSSLFFVLAGISHTRLFRCINDLFVFIRRMRIFFKYKNFKKVY